MNQNNPYMSEPEYKGRSFFINVPMCLVSQKKIDNQGKYWKVDVLTNMPLVSARIRSFILKTKSKLTPPYSRPFQVRKEN